MTGSHDRRTFLRTSLLAAAAAWTARIPADAAEWRPLECRVFSS